MWRDSDVVSSSGIGAGSSLRFEAVSVKVPMLGANVVFFLDKVRRTGVEYGVKGGETGDFF